MQEARALLNKLRPTFELFASELSSHLEEFRELLLKIESLDDADACCAQLKRSAKKTERDFHLIKGGAGFLKLHRIAELAGQGEGWSKKAGSRPEDISESMSELRALVEALETEAELLQQLLSETAP